MKTCVEKHDFEMVLKEAGLRLTKGRLAILVALHTQGAQSADELRNIIGGTFDRVTAYRTLKQLVSVGIVVPAMHTEGAMRYELADHHRHALVCTHCGAMEELPECGFERLEKRVLKKSRTFSEVRAHAVEFFGVCNQCA